MNSLMNGGDRPSYPVPVGESLPSLERHGPVPGYENSFALQDYLDILARRKGLIFVFTGVLVLLGLAISLLMKPVYRAQASVELNANAPKVTKFADLMDDRSQPDEFIKTQIELFQSDTLAKRVIEELGLAGNPDFNPFMEQSGAQTGFIAKLKGRLSSSLKAVKHWLHLKNAEENPNPAMVQMQQQVLLEAAFAKHLDVQPKAGTNIITVAFSSSDPILARSVSNELINQFISWQMDRRMDATQSAKGQLQKQINNVRSQLDLSEGRLNRFAKEAGIVSLDSKSNLIYQQLEEINQALAKIEADRVAKKETYEQAKNSDVSSLPIVLQNTLIQNLKDQYINLMSEYGKLRVTYKDNYPTVKSIRAKMLDINRKISEEQQRILNSLRTEYLQASKVEKALAGKAEEKKAMALRVNALASQYKILEREVETNKQIYQSLLERSKEIDANVGTDLGNIQLVDFASLPLKPYKPNIVLNILAAVILGLMGGTGLAFLREYLDNTVKRVDEISGRHSVPILGVIPSASKRELAYQDSSLPQKTASGFAEAIRFARMSILFSSSEDNPAKSLLVTSTAAGEGKSVISVNLACSFADTGEKVVLIDGDLRKPAPNGRSSNGNGRSEVRGLTHFLSGIVTAGDILQKTETENLYFIPSGAIPPNPTELLSSRKLTVLIDELMERFDRVIFDGPPFGSDVLVLSNRVNGVILITTLGQTQRAALQVFRKYLLQTNGRLIGSIVNRVNLSQYPETRHYQNCYSYKGCKAENFLECTN